MEQEQAGASAAELIQNCYTFLTSTPIPALLCVLLSCFICAAWVRAKLKNIGLRCDGEHGLNWNAILAAQASLWFGLFLLSIVFYLFEMKKLTILHEIAALLQTFIVPSLILAGLEHHRIEQSQLRSQANREERQQELRWVTYIGYAFALITLSSISLSFWFILSAVLVFIWLYQQPKYRKKMNAMWASLQAGHKLRNRSLMPGERFDDIKISGPIGLLQTEVICQGKEQEMANYDILNRILHLEKQPEEAPLNLEKKTLGSA